MYGRQPKPIDFKAGCCRMVAGAATYVVNPARCQVTRALAERAAATLSRPDDDAPSGRSLPAPIQSRLTALADARSTTDVVVFRGMAFDRFDDLPDNHVAAHGRAAFRSRYDGNDRWMRRFFAVRVCPVGLLR